MNVEFFGKSAHAAASPWLGRSALDALVLFDHAMALMREHIKPTARIHRMVSERRSGRQHHPDHTKGQYWLRDATGDSVNEMLGRLRKAAEGAALATETRAQVTLLFGAREPVPNDALDAVLQKELERVGPPPFDDTDQEFAKAMQKELGFEELGMATAVQPFAPKNGGTASSDIGEVSAVVPLAELERRDPPARHARPPLGADRLRRAPDRLQGNGGRRQGPRRVRRRPARRPRARQGREGRFPEGDQGQAVRLAAAADAKPRPF